MKRTSWRYWRMPGLWFSHCQKNNPCAHIMPSVRWPYMISLPDTRSHLNAVLWGDHHRHLLYETLFPMLWRSDLVIGSSKEKTPAVRVHAFSDWVSRSHCLFLLMLHPDGKNKWEVYLAWVMTGFLLSTPKALRVSYNQYTQVLKCMPILTNNKAGMKIIVFVGSAHPFPSLAQEAATASPRLRGAVFHPLQWQPHSCHSRRMLAMAASLSSRWFFFFLLLLLRPPTLQPLFFFFFSLAMFLAISFLLLLFFSWLD